MTIADILWSYLPQGNEPWQWQTLQDLEALYKVILALMHTMVERSYKYIITYKQWTQESMKKKWIENNKLMTLLRIVVWLESTKHSA